VRKRIASQTTNDARIAAADVVIRNEGDLDTLKAAVAAEWVRLKERLPA